MKRKRPLLFDVLGSDEQPKRPRKPEKAAPARRKARRSAGPSGSRSSSGTPPRPKAASRPRPEKPARAPRREAVAPEPRRREIRVSQELGAVIAVVAVVFVGLSYYLGTLHGGSQIAGGRLAKGDLVEPQSDSTPTAPERYWAVQVATLQWRGPAEKEEVLARYRVLRDHLRSRGYPEVMGRLNRTRSQLAVYVGRAERSSSELKKLWSRVLSETEGGRQQFPDAYMTLLDARGPSRASPDENR